MAQRQRCALSLNQIRRSRRIKPRFQPQRMVHQGNHRHRKLRDQLTRKHTKRQPIDQNNAVIRHPVKRIGSRPEVACGRRRKTPRKSDQFNAMTSPAQLLNQLPVVGIPPGQRRQIAGDGKRDVQSEASYQARATWLSLSVMRIRFTALASSPSRPAAISSRSLSKIQRHSTSVVDRSVLKSGSSSRLE